MASQSVTFTVNGKQIEVDPSYRDWRLVRYLREVLGLTGTKQSCDFEGTCGACTVMINGKPARSCIQKIDKLQDAVIETIESLQVKEEIPHPILQTVIQDGIFQCGYCAPGAIMAAKSLLDRNSDPSGEEISRALSTVICRCVGLNRMDQSVKRAAAILRGEATSTWTPEDNANHAMMLDKLTGRLKYTDDLVFPGMLFARALRARVPHGKLRSLDTSQAEAVPGVVAILTARDLPAGSDYGLITEDTPILVRDHIRCVGDALALVVGESPEAVQEALQKIVVGIEELPVVPGPLEALQPGAAVVHERLAGKNGQPPNLLKKFQVRKGSIEEGFRQAAVVAEGEYTVPFVDHAFMEIECSIGVPEGDGTVTVYCGSQGPTDDRRQVAVALGWPEERVRIAHMYIGGGFGGKEDVAGQIHVALAAVKTGKPVKMLWDRQESLLVHPKRHAMKLFYRTAASQDGRVLAADIRIYGDTGAYASGGEAVLFRSNAFACGPYVVPNVHVDSHAVHTNNPPAGAFRGYGSPQVAFASEIQMQKMATALGMDPIEFRLKNALDIGKMTITGDVVTVETSAGVKSCLEAVRKELKLAPLPQLDSNEKIGVGVAAAYKNVGLGSNIPDGSGAAVSLEEGGYFLVRHGAADMGQGVNQVVAVIAARVLGVPLSRIKVHTGDTRYDPHGGMTTASRATFVTGNAALLASQGFRQKLWAVVASEFGVPEDELEIRDEVFVNAKSGQSYISLAELAQGDERLEYQATYQAPKTQPPPDVVDSQADQPLSPLHFAYCYGAQGVIVAVNEETGVVRVLKLIAAHDAGLPIIEQNVIGQIEGAAVQGIGYALSETFEVEQGQPSTLKFKDLGLLRFRDLPEIKPIIVEDPHPLGPFGAKGMGELAISPTAPAIANAIYDAVGVWVTDLPITKEKVLKALEAKKL